MDLTSKKCEGCQLKYPIFGLAVEGKKRWCSGCAKAHAGAVDVRDKKCEGCQLKGPRFGLLAEGKKVRWCTGCAPKGATSLSHAKPSRKTQYSVEKAADLPLTISDL